MGERGGEKMAAGRIVLLKGAHGNLDIFGAGLKRGFERIGYEVFEFDSSDMVRALGGLHGFVKEPVDAAIGFNNLGLNMELVEGESIWESLRIPFVDILVDHPAWYMDALDRAPARTAVLTIDRKHMDYVSRYFPNINICGFLPHGGTESAAGVLPMADRRMGVLYAGGNADAFREEAAPDFSVYDFDCEAVADDALALMISSPDTVLEEALPVVLGRHGVSFDANAIKQLCRDLGYLESLAASHYRNIILKSLAESGVDITLAGAGWDICPWVSLPNVDYLGKVSAPEVLDLMGRSKIVLNTMTWFKDGAHERVFNGMLNGAAVVTDSTEYLRETFANPPFEMFDLSDCGRVVDIVCGLLSDGARLQEISRAGRNAAAAHTWEKRAEEIAADLIPALGAR